jgi:hypothetical protein
MRRSGGLLEAISLYSEPGEDASERFDFKQRQTELWDRAALAYIENRIRDEKFRKEIQAILKRVPAKRGAKPRNDISPLMFYHLLNAEKKALNSKTIRKAAEKHYQIRGVSLDPDLIESLKSKYEEGQKQDKKRGNSE